MFFPVVVKGTKADCERMFADALANAPAPQPKTDTPDLSDDEEMEMLELEAEALQLAIKLKLALLDDEPKLKIGDRIRRWAFPNGPVYRIAAINDHSTPIRYGLWDEKADKRAQSITIDDFEKLYVKVE